MIPKGWLTFESKNEAFDFTFQYPPDWRTEETKGRTEEYDLVNAYGPRDQENQFTVAYGITVQSAGEKSASNLIDQYTNYLAHRRNFKILNKKSAKVNGKSFPGVRLQYVTRLPLYQANAKDVLMGEETYMITKQERSYRITLLGTAEQFRKNYPVFHGMLKTFQFKKN